VSVGILSLAVGCGSADGRRIGHNPGLAEDTDAGSEDGGTDAEEPEEIAESTGSPLDELSEYILGLGHLAIAAYVPKSETVCNSIDCPQDGQEGEEFCNYVHYEETVHAGEFVAFQPNSATLWPGNIVQGDDAQYGLLTPIGLTRSPMTFSVSLENLQGSPVGHMEAPSLSSFREQRNAILAAGTNGAVPAQVSYDMMQVYDASQVAVAVGGSLDWLGAASISSLFEFASDVQFNRVLVDFTQAYYTIDIDVPGLPSDFFADDVTVPELEVFTGYDNPPMYVQSITYGRRVIFAIESTYTMEEIRVAFDAGFDAFVVSGGVELDVQYREIFEQSKVSALVLGGSGSDAVKTVFGVEGLFEYIAAGGDYSKDSPGAPIAYKLAYLDNSGTQFALTTEYAERQCYDNFLDVTGEVARMEYLGGNDDGSGAVQVFGNLMFRVAPASDADPCRADAPDWQVIFDRNDNGAQDVYGIWVPTNPVQLTVYELEAEPDANLCIRGHLREADDCWFFCDNDDFGKAAVGPIKLSQGWAGDHLLEFSDEGTVQAVVRISVD
jgi:hypothetical protein